MSIPKVSIRQIKAARALLGWSQAILADRSGVSLPTVKRLEAADVDGGMGGRQETIDAIRNALETAGVIFLSEGDVTFGGPGVRLK